MSLKVLYVLLGADIILTLLRIEASGFGQEAWPIMAATLFVVVAIVVGEVE